MALANSSNEYVRVLLNDTAALNLASKIFVLEHSKDQSARNDNSKWRSVREYPKVNLSAGWALEITGSTTQDDIATEAYRCLKLSNEFGVNSDWVDA